MCVCVQSCLGIFLPWRRKQISTAWDWKWRWRWRCPYVWGLFYGDNKRGGVHDFIIVIIRYRCLFKSIMDMGTQNSLMWETTVCCAFDRQACPWFPWPFQLISSKETTKWAIPEMISARLVSQLFNLDF